MIAPKTELPTPPFIPVSEREWKELLYLVQQEGGSNHKITNNRLTFTVDYEGEPLKISLEPVLAYKHVLVFLPIAQTEECPHAGICDRAPNNRIVNLYGNALVVSRVGGGIRCSTEDDVWLAVDSAIVATAKWKDESLAVLESFDFLQSPDSEESFVTAIAASYWNLWIQSWGKLTETIQKTHEKAIAEQVWRWISPVSLRENYLTEAFLGKDILFSCGKNPENYEAVLLPDDTVVWCKFENILKASIEKTVSETSQLPEDLRKVVGVTKSLPVFSACPLEATDGVLTKQTGSSPQKILVSAASHWLFPLAHPWGHRLCLDNLPEGVTQEGEYHEIDVEIPHAGIRQASESTVF